MLKVSIDLQVPFYDLDPMEVVWHGNYARYFELGRCALLKKLDYNYPQMQESGYLWPVIDMHIRYARPAKFDQHLIVEAKLLEWEHRMKIAYEIRDKVTGERITRGSSVQVAVEMKSGEMCYESPPVFTDKVQHYLENNNA